MYGQEEETMETEQPTNVFQNVMEPWNVYDTVLVSPEFFGSEKTVQGWFQSMSAFGQEQDHLFFKQRNRGNCSLAYNNQQSADRSDFAFHVMSLGVSFWGPPRTEELIVEYHQRNVAHFFQFDLPNHCAVSFRLASDVKLEANCYHCPPGYGPHANGVSDLQYMQIAQNGSPAIENIERSKIVVGTQGQPIHTNRFKFDTPISIPRNETFEVSIIVSEYARSVLQSLSGPGYYEFAAPIGGDWDGPLRTFPVRYGITVSLYGVREVQQRGEYHAIANR